MKEGLSSQFSFEKASGQQFHREKQATEEAQKNINIAREKHAENFGQIRFSEKKETEKVQFIQGKNREEDLMKARVNIVQPALNMNPMPLTQKQIEQKANNVVLGQNVLEIQAVNHRYRLERETAETFHRQEIEHILSQDEKKRSMEEEYSSSEKNEDMSW